ncbi:MAG: hypothetical protein M3203_11270 [Actinomycetota bacterium]|nr:hypothetical protein [Actinomycetota bacterium]
MGSRIAAEVIVGLLEGDRNSFLAKKRDWMPTLLSAAPGTFTMADLLDFVGGLNPLGLSELRSPDTLRESCRTIARWL